MTNVLDPLPMGTRDCYFVIWLIFIRELELSRVWQRFRLFQVKQRNHGVSVSFRLPRREWSEAIDDEPANRWTRRINQVVTNWERIESRLESITMSGVRRVRRVGLSSAIVGALFVPYALTKGYLSSLIVLEGWRLGPLSPVQTSQLFHVVEAIPLLVMLLGFVTLDRLTVSRSRLADAGLVVTVAGFGLTIATHLGEHLLPPVTVPALTGGDNWFMLAYYLSWAVLSLGLSLYGLALLYTGETPRWLRWWFALILPATIGIGLFVTTFDIFTFAGTFRLLHSITWILAGGWLWVGPIGWTVPSRNELVVSSNTDDR